MMNKKMWLTIEGVDNPIDALFDSYFDNRGCDNNRVEVMVLITKTFCGNLAAMLLIVAPKGKA